MALAGTPAWDGVLAQLTEAGVAVSETDRGWLGEVAAAAATPEEFIASADLGVGGHELAMLDFDRAAADRLRALGRLIGAPVRPGVETALAIAGSVAQGRVHPFPSDIDFFERVHVTAATEAEARSCLADLVLANALAESPAGDPELDEVWFGTRADGLPGTQPAWAGSALSWTRNDLLTGAVTLTDPDGTTTISWEEAARAPGLVKLDWLLSAPALGGPTRVSKVIDATWLDPSGAVVSLDGLLDADLQQVYLDARGAALAARLTGAFAISARADYLARLEREIVRHSRERPPCYGKVAKRLYNLCRLTDRYAEALYLRHLFASPLARLDRTRLHLELIALKGRHDPAGARSDLALALADLREALDGDPAGTSAVAACRALAPDAPPDELSGALATLDAALAALANRAFAEGLHAFAPVADLLAAIIEGEHRGAETASR